MEELLSNFIPKKIHVGHKVAIKGIDDADVTLVFISHDLDLAFRNHRSQHFTGEALLAIGDRILDDVLYQFSVHDPDIHTEIDCTLDLCVGGKSGDSAIFRDIEEGRGAADRLLDFDGLVDAGDIRTGSLVLFDDLIIRKICNHVGIRHDEIILITGVDINSCALQSL